MTDIQSIALVELSVKLNEECLWKAIVVFQNELFLTASGLPYKYKLRIGKNGSYTKELIVNRCEGSKPIVWSSVMLAFHNALKLRGTVIERPKALGDIRGISYIYPMLYLFGVIEVPEKYQMVFKNTI